MPSRSCRRRTRGKHVFCEKPLSLSRAGRVASRRRPCNDEQASCWRVGHEKRFEPPIQELLRLAESGALGTPLQIEANFSQDKFLSLPADNWRLSAKEAPAGPMTATGIHLLDLSVGLMGAAERVFARVRQLGSQLVNGDTLGILVRFKSRRQRAAQRDARHALRRALRGIRQQGLGRGARQGASGGARGMDAHRCHPRASEKRSTGISRRHRRCLPIWKRSRDAAQGGAPYPVPQEQMIANVCGARGHHSRSARSGRGRAGDELSEGLEARHIHDAAASAAAAARGRPTPRTARRSCSPTGSATARRSSASTSPTSPRTSPRA